MEAPFPCPSDAATDVRNSQAEPTPIAPIWIVFVAVDSSTIHPADDLRCHDASIARGYIVFTFRSFAGMIRCYLLLIVRSFVGTIGATVSVTWVFASSL